MTSYPLSSVVRWCFESPELAAALSALSQMEQEIIFLYYFQRLTHRRLTEIWTGWQHNRAAYSDDFTAATGRVGGFVP